MIDWLFRNRRTGRITVFQFPNLPLGIFIVAAVVRVLFDPSGGAATAVDLIATAGLVWWGADEVIRGVNPWRRFLGAGILAYVLFGFIAR